MPLGTVYKINIEQFLTNNIKEIEMEKWVCIICSYVYDPEVGDPDNGVEPGTAFEDIPEDWTCPDCGVDKGSFEKE